MYVCWLGFEVIFVYLYVVETKNVSTPCPGLHSLADPTALSLHSTANPRRNCCVSKATFGVADGSLTITYRIFDGPDMAKKLADEADVVPVVEPAQQVYAFTTTPPPSASTPVIMIV